MDLAACGEIGRSQDGLILRRQALKFLSANQINTLLKSCTWQSLYPGVFLTGMQTPTWDQRVRGAVLGRGKNAVISHRTAAFVLGLIERQPSKVDVMTPVPRVVDMAGTVGHRTRRWYEQLVQMSDGVPLSRPSRTIVDLSTCASRKTLQQAVDAGITTGLISIQDIYEELDLMGMFGRRQIPLLLSVLASRSSDFETTTNISEAEWLAEFAKANLPIPERQFPLHLSKSKMAYPDFAYPQLKLAIEIVSWRWHGGPNKYEQDKLRSTQARAIGWEIVEITRKMSPADAIPAVRTAYLQRSQLFNLAI